MRPMRDPYDGYRAAYARQVALETEQVRRVLGSLAPAIPGGVHGHPQFHDRPAPSKVKQPHAPRIATLEGKRIGFVSNEQWQAYRMLPQLKDLLEQDFPSIEGAAVDAVPQGNAVIGSRDRGAGEGERGRRGHRRQRGLRGLRHSMRPCSR